MKTIVLSALLTFSAMVQAEPGLPCDTAAQTVLAAAQARDRGVPVYESVNTAAKITKNADAPTKKLLQAIAMLPYKYPNESPERLANDFYLGCMKSKGVE